MRLAAALMAVAALAQDARVLAPPDGAVFAEGAAIRVIARVPEGAAVTVDGKPAALESPHAGVAAGVVKLGPGEHRIAAGGSAVKIAVGGGAATFRAHPPVDDCTSCHMVRGGRWRFLRASLSNVCSNCHAKDAFAAKHTHQMDTLPDCQMCHDAHGGTAAALMKMSRDKACAQCHSLQK
ncbi:MAG: cytochrome c3 family protein [Bryobacteraceae bacterium]